MYYLSTRGEDNRVTLEHVLTHGLASDGGLYMPERLPHYTMEQWEAWRHLPYPALAHVLGVPFIGDSVSEDVYRTLCEEAWHAFSPPRAHDHEAGRIPLVALEDGLHVLELFHGPTLAFKDYAMQLLARLFSHVVQRQNRHMTLLGATSGDTGSAAIHACLGRHGIRICILHPHNRVSPCQRRQMTTVKAENVLNIAIEGSFDDCQRIVKTLFLDNEFARRFSLGSVNSVNWVRIMAQIPYYAHAVLRMKDWRKGVIVVVPTGNFGNIFAGFCALCMGLPIRRLVIGSNHNDVLVRVVETGIVSIGASKPSLSPSMDIQLPSNLERWLYRQTAGHHTEKANAVTASMRLLQESRQLSLSSPMHEAMGAVFSATRVDDDETMKTMAWLWETYGYVSDPHTAVGIAAARAYQKRYGAEPYPIVCLATAHAAKFADSVSRATGVPCPSHPTLDGTTSKEEHYDRLPPIVASVKSRIEEQWGSCAKKP
ncbi:MAG: threonine synthase [Alphaproteobacteria bacterium GM7ARS4]|nr:threonine synthase [Alphaproteobacteria bacterium GM7ARS4]